MTSDAATSALAPDVRDAPGGAGGEPVDPWPAFRGGPRAGRSEDEHRRAVAPRVVYRHRGAQQPDIRVHGRRHPAAGYLRVAVRNRDRALLVDHERPLPVA